METLDYRVARKRMVEEQLIPGGVYDPRVLKTMGKVPRHRFVEKGLEDQAYLDRPLKIGSGQTISQPLIVGVMTQALALKGNEKILEIGTGCGYQTVILAQLAKEVFTVERIRDLSLRARKILYRFGCEKNVHFKIGDGTLGWPDHAPYDAVIVTAAGPEVPRALQNQLGEGGRMIIPVGSEENQQLYLLWREKGEIRSQVLSACRFVKLVGEEGWRSE